MVMRKVALLCFQNINTFLGIFKELELGSTIKINI